jgi:hypothetical protein
MLLLAKNSQAFFIADLHFLLVVFILRQCCVVGLIPRVIATPHLNVFGDFKFGVRLRYLNKPWYSFITLGTNFGGSSTF